MIKKIAESGSSNIYEVIRIIYRKILQSQKASKRKKVHKQTKNDNIFMYSKTSKKKKVK